jgi:hypothetical protein
MTKEERAAEVERIKLDSWLNEQTAKYALIKARNIKVATDMFAENLPLDLISRISDIPINDVQKLQQGLPI